MPMYNNVSEISECIVAALKPAFNDASGKLRKWILVAMLAIVFGGAAIVTIAPSTPDRTAPASDESWRRVSGTEATERDLITLMANILVYEATCGRMSGPLKEFYPPLTGASTRFGDRARQLGVDVNNPRFRERLAERVKDVSTDLSKEQRFADGMPDEFGVLIIAWCDGIKKGAQDRPGVTPRLK